MGDPDPHGPPGTGLGAAPCCNHDLPLSLLICERRVPWVWLGQGLCWPPHLPPRGFWQPPVRMKRGGPANPPSSACRQSWHQTALVAPRHGQSPKPVRPVCRAGHGQGRAQPGAAAPVSPGAASPRRLIELHSPDSRNTLILRCKDTATAHSWFTALHANITALLPQVLAELNAMLGTGGAAAGGREVKHVAWLAEQVRTAGAVPKMPVWCRSGGQQRRRGCGCSRVAAGELCRLPGHRALPLSHSPSGRPAAPRRRQRFPCPQSPLLLGFPSWRCSSPPRFSTNSLPDSRSLPGHRGELGPSSGVPSG